MNMGSPNNKIAFKSLVKPKNYNTFKFETGLHHGEKLSSICSTEVRGQDIDKKGGFEEHFSLKNRQEAWGENYKENNAIITRSVNGKEDIRKMPSILGGGMGIDISSLSLTERASVKNAVGDGYAVSSHLASIGISFFKKPNLYEDDGKGFEKYANQVEEDFYKLFEIKLGLSKQQIEEHFLRPDDYLNLEKENFTEGLRDSANKKKTYLDSSFQTSNKNGRTLLMNDLTHLYKDISKGKDQGLFIPVNHMYKSTSYVSTIKIAALAGVDAITTGAGIPRTGFKDKDNTSVNPRNIVSDFFTDIGKTDMPMPAFGLIVSMTMAFAPGYDYYIVEDPRSAGGHQGALESMLKYEKKVGKKSVIDSLRKRAGIDENTPIYAGGGINSAQDIKLLLDIGYNGVQLGTLFAVSEEARDGEGEEFKESLISGNHYGPESEIDKIAKISYNKLKDNILNELETVKGKINNILTNEEELKLNNKYKDNEIENVLGLIMNEILNTNTTGIESLNENEKEIYNEISKKITEVYDGDIEELKSIMKSYGNLNKAFEELKRFEKKGILPTHLLFDSVVGFIGRLRINGGEHRLLNGEVMKSSKCIQCVTHCILRNIGGVQENRGSRFCIADSLRVGHVDEEKSLVLHFSGLTTSFYDEIRPIKDILLAYMGTSVKRKKD